MGVQANSKSLLRSRFYKVHRQSDAHYTCTWRLQKLGTNCTVIGLFLKHVVGEIEWRWVNVYKHNVSIYVRTVFSDLPCDIYVCCVSCS